MKKLDLKLETGGGEGGEHPAARMFTPEPAAKKRASTGTKRPAKKPAGGKKLLKRSDRDVFDYLKSLLRGGGGTMRNKTCTASNREIAEGADISERQVQISVRRLIGARALRRVRYDFGNPDKEKRGTTYEVLTEEFPG